ncbi:MAG: hypothetical protein QG614_93, partial [Patescibacteria group bacterium]|nr:hypothetical protein [Patescibacteria group bacterium]
IEKDTKNKALLNDFLSKREISAKASGEEQNYRLQKSFKQYQAKEKLYKDTYGDKWLEKYNAANSTLRFWGENRYNKAKAGMKDENYGSLELEHALTQAYYTKNGVKEVDIYWGIYGKTAQSVIDGKNVIKKDLTSVTSSKEIAKSYAEMARVTSGTKRLWNKKEDLPPNGVIVKAKVPIERIVISKETVASTRELIPRDSESKISSPGSWLHDQSELIIDVPPKADTSNFELVKTSDVAYERHGY